MSENAMLLRLAGSLPMDPRHRQLLIDSADEIERLRSALEGLADAATPIFTEDGMTTFGAHTGAAALWDATGKARGVLRGLNKPPKEPSNADS